MVFLNAAIASVPRYRPGNRFDLRELLVEVNDGFLEPDPLAGSLGFRDQLR